MSLSIPRPTSSRPARDINGDERGEIGVAVAIEGRRRGVWCSVKSGTLLVGLAASTMLEQAPLVIMDTFRG
jgi:hypothetical protein